MGGCFGLPNWVLGSTDGLGASAWALGAGTNALFFPAGCPRVVCGNVRPAAKVLAGSWGDSLGAFHCMLNSCCDRVGTAREGVLTPSLLGISNFVHSEIKRVSLVTHYVLHFD